jgi:hypothetical protein
MAHKNETEHVMGYSIFSMEQFLIWFKFPNVIN